MRNVLCVILGGGQGKRLYPLTKYRSKPAVPLAGKYRLIDVPISNCLNSDMRQIYILTQFLSESLNKHVNRAYKVDSFSRGFVEIMAAEQSMEDVKWFQGTADAVRRCLKHFNDPTIEYIVILSGDQLYKLNIRALVRYHIHEKADITIACNAVLPNEIPGLGIMGINNRNVIERFVEKPKDPKQVHGMEYIINNQEHYLASMGIYCFKKEMLTKILNEDSSVDFGKGIIPNAFPRYKTYAFVHRGYWYDIGTIKAFYEANLNLADPVPELNLFDKKWGFFTHPRFLPPAKIEESTLSQVLVCEGAIINGSNLRHSVVGLRSVIKPGSDVRDSIIMGCDYYESEEEYRIKTENCKVRLGIGRNCVVRNAILDKNVTLGDNVQIINKNNVEDYEGPQYCIKNGIVIVEKNSYISSGTVI